MLFLRRRTHPGQPRLILARRPRPLLYKHQRFPIVANQVNLALHVSRHIIPRHEKYPCLRKYQYANVSPRTPRCRASCFTSLNESASAFSPGRARHFTASNITRENVAMGFSRKRSPFATRLMAASINKNPAAAILHLGRRGISVNTSVFFCELCTSALNLLFCLPNAFFQRPQRKVRLLLVNQKRR